MLPSLIFPLRDPLFLAAILTKNQEGGDASGFGLTDWITAIAAAIALVLSVWTHFDTRPRIKITQSVPIVLFPTNHRKWPGAGRLMLDLTVVNDGSQPTQIRKIYLGGNHQGLQLSTDVEGPTVPYTLAGRGGQVTWSFDYESIKWLVQSNYHNGEVSLQGIVEIGRHRHKARPILKVAEYYAHKDQLLPPPTRVQRIIGKLVVARNVTVHWIKRWFKRPSMGTSTVFYEEQDLDLPNALARHKFQAAGPWPVPAHHLIMVARVPAAEGWPTYQRMWDMEPVQIPFSWPKQAHEVWLPIIPIDHGLPAGSEFEWRCEHGGWYGDSSFGALTMEKLNAALTQKQQPDHHA